MRIFLSVGHAILAGGGCTSASGFINEYRYNKALAPYLRNEFIKRGHQCDVVVVPERKYRVWSGERAYKLPIANSGKYDLVIELHLNASNGNGFGSEVLYYPGDTRGYNLAKQISNEYARLGFRNRGAKPRGDLYMIAETTPTALIIEGFFCDNRADCNKADDLGYSKIANAIVNGALGSTSKPVAPPKFEGKYFVMTNTPNDVLNVREQADATSRIVSAYNHNSKIYVHEVVKNGTGTWYKIEYHKGKFGYVSARYCKGIK